MLADLVARTVIAPAELPIGVVTAFLGAPFFAVVLRTTRTVRAVTLRAEAVGVTLDGRRGSSTGSASTSSRASGSA